MASKSISQLTTTYSLSDNDLFIVSKESGSTFVTYKIPYKFLNNKLTKSGVEAVLTGEINTHSHAWANISGKPVFATVATTGSYSDLLNRPSLSSVAFSGSYNDLSNKPTFKTINGNSLVGNGDIVLAQNNAQVNSDWNATSGVAMILNKPNLATVAKTGSYNDLTNKPSLFSGSYTDLTNKPTIPTVGNATITFKQGGVTKGSFTANQTTDVTINLDATTQSGTVSSSDILNTVLTGLDGFQSSGAVVATDSILKAIRKLRDQIAVLTAPPNYGSVSDVGGEGYYPFAVSDGVLYTTSQTITMQPGFYRIVCANPKDADTIVKRVLTGEYLASSTFYPNKTEIKTSAKPNTSNTQTHYSNTYAAGVGLITKGYDSNGQSGGSNTLNGASSVFLKYLFAEIIEITKTQNGQQVGGVSVSHIVHIIEPTEVNLSIGVGSADTGTGLVWIREVPAP